MQARGALGNIIGLLEHLAAQLQSSGGCSSDESSAMADARPLGVTGCLRLLRLAATSAGLAPIMAGRTQLVSLLLSMASSSAVGSSCCGGSAQNFALDAGTWSEHAQLLLALVEGLGPTAVAQSVLSQAQLVPALVALLLRRTGVSSTAPALRYSKDGAALLANTASSSCSADGAGSVNGSSRRASCGEPGWEGGCPVELRLLLALSAHTAFTGTVARSPAAVQLIQALLAIVSGCVGDHTVCVEASAGISESAAQHLSACSAALYALDGLLSGDRRLAALASAAGGHAAIAVTNTSGGGGRTSSQEGHCVNVLLVCAGALAALCQGRREAGSSAEQHRVAPPSAIAAKTASLQPRAASATAHPSRPGHAACEQTRQGTQLLVLERALAHCTRALAAACSASVDASLALDQGGAAALQVLSECLVAAGAAVAAAQQRSVGAKGNGRTPGPTRGLPRARSAAGAAAAAVAAAEAAEVERAEGVAREREAAADRVRFAVLSTLGALAALWAQVTGLPLEDQPLPLASGGGGPRSASSLPPAEPAPRASQESQQQQPPAQQQGLTPESSSASVASMLMSQLGKGSLWGPRPARQRVSDSHGYVQPQPPPLANIDEQPAAVATAADPVEASQPAPGSGHTRLRLVLGMVARGMRFCAGASTADDVGCGARDAPAARHAACCVLHTLLSAGREAADVVLALQPSVSRWGGSIGAMPPRSAQATTITAAHTKHW